MPEECIYPLQRYCRDQGNYTTYYQNEGGKVTRGFFHPSGQFRMEYPDGSVVQVSPGELRYEADGFQITVEHNSDTDIGGHQKVTIAGGSHIEIAGDSAVTIGKESTINVLGNAAVAVQGNAVMGVKGDFNIKAGGKMAFRSQKEMSFGSGAGIKIQAITVHMQKEGDGASGYNMA